MPDARTDAHAGSYTVWFVGGTFIGSNPSTGTVNGAPPVAMDETPVTGPRKNRNERLRHPPDIVTSAATETLLSSSNERGFFSLGS